jgi:diguanylate cyclase (GGDEF)-like protein/PAS domain S-box-containing protein
MSERVIKAVLLIEDNPGDARLIREMFNEQNSRSIELTHVECMDDAEKYLAEHEVDIILADLGLPDTQGLESVRRTRAAVPHVPLVVLSGQDDETIALQALKEGAQDYLIKGQIEPRELLRALRYAVERKIIEETLYTEKEFAQVTLDCIGDAVICTDMAGEITFLNRVAEKMTGWTRKAATGKPMDEIFRIVDSITRQTTPNLIARTVGADGTWHLPLDCTLIRPDGNEISVDDSASLIHDHEGKITGSVLVLRDVSVARVLAEKVIHSAEHDFLTGLPNRLLLNDRIGQAIGLAQRHMHLVAVLFLDLDGFKHINDSLGHPVGDKLLQSVAERLSDCVRAPDTVSRQGGDEFVVLLTEVKQAEDVAIAAKRMLQAVERAHSIDDHELHVTASIGVSLYPDDGLDAETLIKNADTAMYQAKEETGRSCKFFRPEMNIRAVERQSIEEDLRRALELKEFTLHYQPKVNLSTGAIIGAEALIRWTSPTRGQVPPLDFIPIAEDSGLILPIGAWVMQEACAQARAWVDAELPKTTMAVNVSSVQFRNENFLEDLFVILDKTGMDPKYLELEVTESVLMRHAEVAASILQTLRDRGVRVSIDDFGTGYSSLSYLQKIPLDALKIDQSFVREIGTSPDGTTIVRAIISMGRSLNLRIIAEGVETIEDLAFLKAQGCDEGQGYYFSRPVPANQFAKLLTVNADAGAMLCIQKDSARADQCCGRSL